MIGSWKIVVLALGSNLGDRRQILESAVLQLGLDRKIRVLDQSPLVESVAITEDGPDDSKPQYLNGVLKIATKHSPRGLLKKIALIEKLHGRERMKRWESRKLDIDIVSYEDKFFSSKNLTLPHPRAHERDFVLVPWLQMDPDAYLPGRGKVSDLLEKLPQDLRLET